MTDFSVLRPGQVLKDADVKAFLDVQKQRSELRDRLQEMKSALEAHFIEADKRGFQAGIARVLETAVDVRHEMFAANKQEKDLIVPTLTDLACDVVEEIVGEFEPKSVLEAVVRKQLDEFYDDGILTIITSPTDLATIERAVADYSEIEQGDIAVVANEEFGQGSLVIQTKDGYIDVGIRKQLEIARKVLAKQAVNRLMET